MQTACGNTNVFRHGAIHAVSKPASGRIQIIKATAAERGSFIDDRGCFAYHTIAFVKSFRFGTDRCHRSRELMAQDARIVHGPAMGSAPLVNIAPTYTHRADSEQHVGWPDRLHRNGNRSNDLFQTVERGWRRQATFTL